MRVTVATRRSPLALAQSRAVASALVSHGHEAPLLELTTSGDRWSLAGAAARPGMDVKGMFVKELEEALLAGCDSATNHRDVVDFWRSERLSV